MAQIELKHADADHTIRVPVSQAAHFERIGWRLVTAPEQAPAPAAQANQQHENED